MTADKSVRNELLQSSSPLITLIVILSVIGGLLLVVFLSWVRFRRNVARRPEDSPYSVLICEKATKTSVREDVEMRMQTSDKPNDLELQNGTSSPPDFTPVEQLLVGFSIVKRNEQDSSSNGSHLSISRDTSGLAMSDFSIDAMIDTHKRLVEQRERFVADPKHLGLRHMALEHLRIQQLYEKQIMLLKTRTIQSN